jgi:dienelactone hydrolase
MNRRRAAATAGAIAVAALLGAAAYLLRDPLPHFAERRSALAAVVEGMPSVEDGFVLTPVRLTATSGLAVELVVRRAVADRGRTLPLAVILGGHYTGREAARMLGDTHGVVVAALSYPFSGDPRPDAVTFLLQIPRIRAAFLDTPPAVMLALDYLMRMPDVDTSRVEAIGVSLGAPFICIAGALDHRFTRVWSIHGSGGSYAPLEANMRRTISFAPLRVVAAAISDVIIAGPRLDPVHWAPRIAPRPFVMVNASADQRLPRAAVDALYRAAGEPKEQIWMSGGHVHADRETIRRLVDIVMARVRGPEGSARRAGDSRPGDLRNQHRAGDDVVHLRRRLVQVHDVRRLGRELDGEQRDRAQLSGLVDHERGIVGRRTDDELVVPADPVVHVPGEHRVGDAVGEGEDHPGLVLRLGADEGDGPMDRADRRRDDRRCPLCPRHEGVVGSSGTIDTAGGDARQGDRGEDSNVAHKTSRRRV